MPFFQNPFNSEFRASLPFGDRQYSLTFSVPANRNQSQAMVAWNSEPYNFGTYPSFVINFAIDPEGKNYAAITVSLTGAMLASDVVTILNANAAFSQWFTAYTVDPKGNSGVYTVGIKANRPSTSIHTYITNAGADQVLGFNKNAGVAELPTYYARHTIANRFAYPDGLAALVQLDQTDAVVDQPIITAAGFNYSAMQADWQLLGGRVGIFNFQKLTVDGSNRITQIIEYPAGAIAGMLARKISYVYSGSNTSPSQITEVPYTLTSGDLVTP